MKYNLLKYLLYQEVNLEKSRNSELNRAITDNAGHCIQTYVDPVFFGAVCKPKWQSKHSWQLVNLGQVHSENNAGKNNS